MLSRSNSHPRDSGITFREEDHVYTLKNGSHPISVTTLIHKYFPHFDADLIISKMMNSPNWIDSKYFGMTPEEIKAQWSENGATQSNLGTVMHAAIEDWFNGNLPVEPKTVEFGYFKRFWANFQRENEGWRPYRTEWIVYDEKRMISGSIDMVLINEKGNLVLMDWKRSKEIKYDNRWEKGRGPCSHLDHCNYNHYTIQLNMYKRILEENYGKRVVAMFLLVFHPNNDDYVMINVKNKKELIDEIMEERVSSLNE